MKAGQESVWDYPRPPRLESSSARVRVISGDLVLADSTATKRVLETSHPPVYYVPPEDVMTALLRPTDHSTWCEWKGRASYFSLHARNKVVDNAAWSYRHPMPAFRELKHYFAFYPSKFDACYVDDELVQAQEGDFYGGWITENVIGPFKGGRGTLGW